MAENPKNTPPQEQPDKIDYHWIKTESYQTTHVDGAIGAVSPNGKMINMAVYVERWPLPRQTTHPVIKGTVQPGELARIQREGIVREIAVNLTFDESTARSLVDWLNEKIEQIEKLGEVKKLKRPKARRTKANVKSAKKRVSR
jgi:hypothetical protein